MISKIFFLFFILCSVLYKAQPEEPLDTNEKLANRFIKLYQYDTKYAIWNWIVNEGESSQTSVGFPSRNIEANWRYFSNIKSRDLFPFVVIRDLTVDERKKIANHFNFIKQEYANLFYQCFDISDKNFGAQKDSIIAKLLYNAKKILSNDPNITNIYRKGEMRTFADYVQNPEQYPVKLLKKLNLSALNDIENTTTYTDEQILATCSDIKPEQMQFVKNIIRILHIEANLCKLFKPVE